jgi:EamA domain-containing membrane protein RarD
MAHARDYLELHFLVLLWGSTAVLGVLITIPPVELVFYRTLLSALLLAVVLKLRGTRFGIGYKSITYFFLAGVLVAAHWITFFWSAHIEEEVSVV